jgi:hypothetical protein
MTMTTLIQTLASPPVDETMDGSVVTRAQGQQLPLAVLLTA